MNKQAPAAFRDSGYDRKKFDAYWTEPWVIAWLCEAGLRRNKPKSVTWEPACGTGNISKMLKRYGHDVLSTDIHNHGYDGMDGLEDFLGVEELDPAIDMIVTNPPYNIKNDVGQVIASAEGFLRHALKLMKPVDGSVIMLLRNEFDCAGNRKGLFDAPPFSAKFTLTKRPIWLPIEERSKDDSGPMHNYSWFYWDYRFKSTARAFYLPVTKPTPGLYWDDHADALGKQSTA